MSDSSSSTCSILDIPDEILVKIFLHLNARECVVLADSCTRFNSLVFEDEELLRDLDFSEYGRLTTQTDIERYFNRENTRKFVRKVNVQNVRCIRPGSILNNQIGRAINLVDLNIHGTKFSHIDELRDFLEPLINIKRLSVDWPLWEQKDDVPDTSNVLEKTLSRLTYLSVEIFVYSKVFLPNVQLCKELEELRMTTSPPSTVPNRNTSWGSQSNKLKNLRIVQVRGRESSGPLKDHLMAMVPDPSQWTDFHQVQLHEEGYLEKNVRICEAMQKVKLKLPLVTVPFPLRYSDAGVGWLLLSERLLREAIRITHEDAPDEYCCFTCSKHMRYQPCLLKVEEAKRLLIDPGYQITFLQFNHNIESDCDAHLVASAFPTLTELNLSNIVKSTMSIRREKKYCQRRLRRKGSTEPEDRIDLTSQDSSFKMLVENTPHLRNLTICVNGFQLAMCSGMFDLDALFLISSWKNLRTILLKDIPIVDGKFLIDIGKECTQLEEIVFYNLGPSSLCYTSDLVQMLKYCENLRQFSIYHPTLDNIPELFHALSDNLKLRTVRLMTKTEVNYSANLIESIKQLLHKCRELTTFVFMMQPVTCDLVPAIQRIIYELNRPNLQFQGPASAGSVPVDEDASSSFFPSVLNRLKAHGELDYSSISVIQANS